MKKNAKKKPVPSKKAAGKRKDVKQHVSLSPFEVIERFFKSRNSLSADVKQEIIKSISQFDANWSVVDKSILVNEMAEAGLLKQQIAKIFHEGTRWVSSMMLSTELPEDTCLQCWALFAEGKEWIFDFLRKVPSGKRAVYVEEVGKEQLGKKETRELLGKYSGIPGLPRVDPESIKAEDGERFPVSMRDLDRDHFVREMKASLNMAESVFETAEALSSTGKNFKLFSSDWAMILEVKDETIANLLKLCRIAPNLRDEVLSIAESKIRSAVLIAELPVSCQRKVVEEIKSGNNGDLRGLKGIIKRSMPPCLVNVEKHKKKLETALKGIETELKGRDVSEDVSLETRRSVRNIVSSFRDLYKAD